MTDTAKLIAQAEAMVAAGVKVKPLAWELRAERAGLYYSAHDPLYNMVVEAPDEETCDAIDRTRAACILATLDIAPDAQAALDQIKQEAANEALGRAAEVAAGCVKNTPKWKFGNPWHRRDIEQNVAAAIRAMKGGAR